MTVNSATIDERKYASLLSKILPAVIRTEEENERLLAEVDKLIDKNHLSPKEIKLIELLVKLIEDFEEKHYQLNASAP